MHESNFYDKTTVYNGETDATLHWCVERISGSLPASASVLELGLGFGDCAGGFAGRFARHIVIDAAQDVIDRFQREHPDAPVEIVHAYFEEFDTPERFDAVIMGFVLEHLRDPDAVLRRFARFLKPGGRLYVTVPNALALHRRLGREMGLLPDPYALGEYDRAAGHLRYYDRATAQAAVEAAGYTVLRAEGVLLKCITAGQMQTLALGSDYLRACLVVGADHPDIANAILLEASRP